LWNILKDKINMRLMNLLFLLISFVSSSAPFAEKKAGVHVNDKSFPWELVID
jgi:hypothetical protein